MANKKTANRDLSGAQLTKAIAEKVFGWKNVRKHDGQLIGKKQDKVGHWRRAKVPDYSSDQRHAYAIDERMKKLGQLERYNKELAKITKANNLRRNGQHPSSEAKRRSKRWENEPFYLITCSPTATRWAEWLGPICWAAFKTIMSSNLVGCTREGRRLVASGSIG